MGDMDKELNEARMALKELQAEYNTYRKEKMENERCVLLSVEPCKFAIVDGDGFE